LTGANSFDRNNPLVSSFAGMYGMAPEQVDDPGGRLPLYDAKNQHRPLSAESQISPSSNSGHIL
jgi:hypothetical protein